LRSVNRTSTCLFEIVSDGGVNCIDVSRWHRIKCFFNSILFLCLFGLVEAFLSPCLPYWEFLLEVLQAAFPC